LAGVSLRSQWRPVRRLKAHFLGARLLSDKGVVFQSGPADCGPTALQTIAALHNRRFVNQSAASRFTSGWTPEQLVTASREMGLDARIIKVPPSKIPELEPPLIALLGTHYIVVESRLPDGRFIIVDPDLGRMEAGAGYLIRDWTGNVVAFPSSYKSRASAPARHLGALKARKIKGEFKCVKLLV
jgi:ABC-type bacteriocin/lantibiotic exporter with double-glycine peptidase domain